MSGPLANLGAAALVEPSSRDADVEAALVERLRARDPAAVGLVYDLHHRAVRAFARRLVADDQSAEDLVQDVFVALPAAIRRFNQQSALRTFLIGVAINHARHHLRAAARRRRTLARLADVDIRPPPPMPPDQESDRRRLADALARALDELPLKQRLVFILCDLEHRTSTEVGALLGIPDATVRTRLHHARERLRARLIAEGLS
jgi:RNA polymerase sigma-70 factor (ECF subfamily)